MKDDQLTNTNLTSETIQKDKSIIPPSPKSFLSKKTIFATFFVLIIFTLIFVIPFPSWYLGGTACMPCQDKNNCPPCPSQQWILEKPIFWSIILPLLKGTPINKTVQINTSQLTSSPTPTPIDETANWKTYENKTYGYSVKHPIHLIPKDEPGVIKPYLSHIAFKNEGNSKYIIGVLVSENSLNSEIEAQKKFITEVGEGIIKSETKIINNNYAGSKLEYELLEVDSKTIIKRSIVVINNGEYSYIIDSPNNLINQILSTFKFTSPSPTCRPRPACLDATPRCLIPETSDMCPKAVVCTQEVKTCPDGSSVGRQGPNCEFAPCP